MSSRNWKRLALVLLAILAALGASEPEVVRVRIAAAQVSSWFPAGSEIEVLTSDQFDLLLQGARSSARVGPSQPPRILKATHTARLDSGVLTGRSELTIERSTTPGSTLIELDPWSPALDLNGVGSDRFRSTPDGHLAVKVDPSGPRTIEARWLLSGRPGSEGQAFSLALPDVELASLTLDLPSGWVPEAQAGPRVGPEPGTNPDRFIWRFEAARGVIDLRLRNPSDSSGKLGGTGLWVEGTTRVDLNQGPANWRADWTLDQSPGAPQQVTVVLDPGLELVDVVGPRVASFREEPSGAATHVRIKLNGGGSGTSPLIIRAICHAPAEGLWSVPSARPIDATWTGGRTLVTLDGSRVLQACVEKSGRRVAPKIKEPAEQATLIFEGNGSPGPVADLTLRKPVADAIVDIRGHLLLGDDTPRIEVALTWTVERGRLLSQAVDLSPGWTPDQVLSSVKQPVPWHAERLGNGRTRVHIGPSSSDENALMLTLTLTASAWKAGVTGPLDLPRVRPVAGVRVVDEIWAATPDPKLALRPIRGDGLAWIDPLDPPLDDAPAPWVAADLENALAWRWLADAAEGRIDRILPTDRPRAEVKLEASIIGRRLRMNWTLAVESDLNDLRSIPIHLDHPVDSAIHWRSRESGGPIVDVRPLDPARSAKLGFPSTGSSWDLELSGTSRGRIQLEATIDQPWNDRGRIPILTLPDQFRTRGLVSVTVEDTTRLKTSVRNLTSIDLSAASTRPEVNLSLTDSSRNRRAALLAYGSAGGQLEIETQQNSLESNRGLIREAFLVSQVFPGSGIRHRLSLKIAGDPGRPISLKMPAHAVIDRIRRDGQPVVVRQNGSSFLLEIPETLGTRVDSNVTLDYRTPTDIHSGPIEPAFLLPECSLNCLSFVWELIAPEPWDITSDVRGLLATDPKTARSVTARLLGFRSDLWIRPESASTASANAAILAELDQVAAGFADSEISLGDWLLKLDSGRWPLVIDRLALRSMGLGPNSQVPPLALESKLLGPLKGVLQPLGLVALPLGGTVLLTSRLDLPEGSAERLAWASTLKLVPSQGSDSTDRFQSAPRWRGEASPRALAAGESLERFPGSGDWQIRRLVTTGWPAPGASVRLIDTRAEQAWGWLVASVGLVLGVLARNRPARIRGVGLILVGFAASAVLAWTWPDPPTWATGWFRGYLAISAIWIGRSFRPSTSLASIEPDQGSTTSRRSGFQAGVVGSSLVLTIMASLFTVASAAQLVPDPPILALLVFDGAPDATSKPDRVILSLKDARRLRQLALPEPPVASPRLSLLDARHEVIPGNLKQATVESRFEVDVAVANGQAPTEWKLPVGNAFDLSAKVDGNPWPLRISGDGRWAIVAFEKPGHHTLMFRRSLTLQDFGGAGKKLALPINPAAFARVSVGSGAGTQSVEIPLTSGRIDPTPEGLEGNLGPMDQLEVRWFSQGRPPISGFQGAVETTALWDARPVGDLIRLRLSHSDPDGASTIRLALEPGLIVRRHSIPNLVNIRQEGTIEQPIWVARVDPPLPRDVPIEVDLWRTAIPGAVERRWPSINVVATGKVNMLLGFRRPGDWSGRLDPGAGLEVVTEATFTKVWGRFEDAGLILAGAGRFNQSPSFGVAIRPLPLRRSIQTKVMADLVPGRLNMAIEAILTDIQGRSFDLELGLPNDLRLIRVEAVGLVDWQKPARDRLRLQFDGTEVHERRVRIEGYLPVPSDSVMTEARSYQARIPWPRWVDAESTSGTLMVSGPTRFQVDPGDGVVSIPSVAPPDLDVPFQSTYRIDRPAGLSAIRWSAPLARFNVSVQSDLTIDPDSILWTAVIDCEIAGGPADSLQWNIPTEWSRNATIEIVGHAHRLVSELKGSKGETTHWTILPESPLWGRVKLLFRSRRPIQTDALLLYPEIAPLAAAGRGAVERYELTIANVSGRELKLEGARGLDEIDDTRYRSDDSLGLLGSVDYAYQVTGGRWSLGLRIGRSDEAGVSGRESKPSQVALASITGVVGEDGQIWGRARFDLEEHSGPFLAFELAEPAEIPSASVDGLSQPVIHEGPGRWLVPLGDRQARRVDLTWHRREGKSNPGMAEVLAIPRFPSRNPPTLVAMFAPPSVAITSPGSAFSKLDRSSWEVVSAELLATRVLNTLEILELNSARDRELVIEDIVDLELRARSLSRKPVASPGSSGPAVERIRALIAAIDKASESTGFVDLFQEAQARAGLVREYENPSTSKLEPNGELIRVRKIGVPSYFRSTEDDARATPSFTWSSIPVTPVTNRLERCVVVGVGVLVTLGLSRWVGRTRGRLRRRYRVAAIVVMGIAAFWEPLGIVAFLGLIGLGRKTA